MSEAEERKKTGALLLLFFSLVFLLGQLATSATLYVLVGFVLFEVFRIAFGGHFECNPLKILVPNLAILALFVYSVYSFSDMEIFVKLVALTMASIGISDTGAYFCGKRWGKSLGQKFFGQNYLLAPKTSPNKTIIGAVGGVSLGSLFFAVVGFICFDLHILLGLYIGILCTVTAACGDWIESKAKRLVGEKDSGSEFTAKILKGHGGFWDRFDAQIPGLTVVLILFEHVV